MVKASAKCACNSFLYLPLNGTISDVVLRHFHLALTVDVPADLLRLVRPRHGVALAIFAVERDCYFVALT